MSFSSQVKDSITSLKFKNKCCKKSFIYGALMGADISGGNLVLKVTHEESATLISDILQTVFKIKDIDLQSVLKGVYSSNILTFCLPTGFNLLSDIDRGIDTEQTFENIFSCNTCVSYFFAGVFCAAGSITDPEKSYMAEMRLPNEKRAEKLKALFEAYTDLSPSMCKKGKGYSVYFHNGDGVGGFLSLFRISSVIFDFFNTQLENQLRAEEQRATNCVTINIQKTVSANSSHIKAINSLIESGRFYMLPDELRLTARLRIDNPELSLKALASLHTPPITKSGLNHRLEKIIKIAEEPKEN